MKISTEIGSAAKIIGMENAVKMCAEAGFDAWDFSMFDMCRVDGQTGQPIKTDSPLAGDNYLEFARKLKRIGNDNGIICNQSHAPFPVSAPVIRSYLKRAIECTAEAGGKICVIHPNNNHTAEQNAQMYAELLPFARQCGVKIATENMWNWDHGASAPTFAACATGEDFKKHIMAVNDDHFVACLDIGHAQMRTAGGGAVNMIKALGCHLQALHIHDNDLLHDSHQIPFSMDIDFLSILKALKEIDYKGYFTLEADRYLEAYNKQTVFDGMLRLKDSAKRLSDMFEAM